MKSKQETEKARVYLAGPFFSEGQIDRVMRLEAALEANPFVEAYFSPRLNQVETLAIGSKAWRSAVFAQDVNNLDWATVVVAIADMDHSEVYMGEQGDFITDTRSVHTDSGTAWELGYAYATGKPAIILHETEEPLNLMISDSLHYYTKSMGVIADYNFIKMPKGAEYEGEVI